MADKPYATQLKADIDYEKEYARFALLPINYQKPKAQNYVDLCVEEFLKNTIEFSQYAFIKEYAQGTFLDVIGSWHGVTRFFSGGALNDDDFRVLIDFAIAFNSVEFLSLQEIEDKYKALFGDKVAVSLLEDRMQYFFDSSITDGNILKAVLENKLLISPQDYFLDIIKKPEANTRYLVYSNEVGERFNTEIYSSFWGESSDTYKVRYIEESDKINID